MLTEPAGTPEGGDQPYEQLREREELYRLLTENSLDLVTLLDLDGKHVYVSPSGKGTGLGLAMVYGFVKQTGGHIEVYSEVGHGTSFKVYLPRAERGTAATRSATTTLEVPRGSETVLLVEDEVAVRNLSKFVLESSGYTVLEAGHGQEALTVAREHEGAIHLLVTDVVMPGMSGRQLANALGQFRPATRVLFMSGYTDEAVLRHGVIDASPAFLQKPFSPIGLARKVREVLDAS